ncbi:hypothetical protein TNCV_3732841 [Trichonephila clavipes]|nr:hypothetical protein TNCV_3732841 [Trichonephila clavipes]
MPFPWINHQSRDTLLQQKTSLEETHQNFLGSECSKINKEEEKLTTLNLGKTFRCSEEKNEAEKTSIELQSRTQPSQRDRGFRNKDIYFDRVMKIP